MKKLIDKMFKKETGLHYILPQYQPTPAEMVNTQVGNSDYSTELARNNTDIDDMQIDRMYGCQ